MGESTLDAPEYLRDNWKNARRYPESALHPFIPFHAGNRDMVLEQLDPA